MLLDATEYCNQLKEENTTEVAIPNSTNFGGIRENAKSGSSRQERGEENFDEFLGRNALSRMLTR